MDLDMLEQALRVLDSGNPAYVVSTQAHRAAPNPPAVAFPLLEQLCGTTDDYNVAPDTRGKLLDIQHIRAGDDHCVIYHVDWNGKPAFYVQEEFSKHVRLS